MIHYLCEFAVRASPDARGAFILPLILPPSAPPTTALFSSFGAAYEVREYQPLTISIGAPRPLASVPPDGAIDARQPTTGRGWDRLVIWFEGPALAVDPKELQVQVSGDAALRIVEARAALDSLTIVFDQPIPAGECATIRHLPSGWSTRLGVLPGDANGDAGTGALDILALVDELSGAGSASRPWQCDINHSGVCEPSDILQLIDLLNGADGLTPWNGKSLRECP
jgi:hypothetical protein